METESRPSRRVVFAVQMSQDMMSPLDCRPRRKVQLSLVVKPSVLVTNERPNCNVPLLVLLVFVGKY